VKICSKLLALALFSAFIPLPVFGAGHLAAVGGHSINVFAELSGARTGQSSGTSWGGSAGGYLQGQLLGFVLRGTADRNGRNIHVYDLVAGPRVSLPVPLLKPFVEITGGLGHAGYYNSTGAFGSGWGPAWQLNAGLQHGIFPRLQWRIVEVGYGHIYTGPGVTPTIVSTGLVLRLW
jgi:hypothetical protein